MIPEKEVEKTIVIDLDGVLASYDFFRGVESFGDPIPGSLEALQRLKDDGYKIIIYTARLNGSHPKYTFDALFKLVKDYLDQHGFLYDEIFTGKGKPTAMFYIDDRGIRFKSWPQAFKEIKEISEKIDKKKDLKKIKLSHREI